MSTYYNIYAEVKIKDKWFCLNPIVKTVDGNYKRDLIFWSQSYFYDTFNYLNERPSSRGLPNDISDDLLAFFHTPLDDMSDGGWSKQSYRDWYNHTIFTVDYYDVIANSVIKDIPYKYKGYVYKRSIAAFEVGEIDVIENWYTIAEYKKISKEEKQDLTWYEWNEAGDEYGILFSIYTKISNLLYWFRDFGIPYDSPYSDYDISSSAVRVYIERA